MTDPVVEEIRKIRDEHARRFNYDLDAICTDLQARQEKSDHRVVRFKPRTVPKSGERRSS